MTTNELYIQRCLHLAQLAKGQVFPNPMVGSAIVHNNKIIGEGYHQKYGGHHAEVNAVNSVKNKDLLKDSTLYVNLEPCCHRGKTPPCTQLIIDSGIKKVVIGSLDPNPLVAGKGVKILEGAGVGVVSGIQEEECLNLNQDFFEQFQTNRTVKFILKWAESADGFIGQEKYNSAEERELSNSLVKRYVHKLRSETDAIMVGTNTALIDNPILDNRYWFDKMPIIVAIDKDLKIPLSSILFRPERKVIILNGLKEGTVGRIIYCKINFNKPKTFWHLVSNELIENGIHSVLLEGGSKTLQSFIDGGLSCEIIRIRTKKIWRTGIKAPVLNINPIEHFNLGDNLIELFSV